jgi:O-antigen/teichoic acid export membrane protein
LFVPVYLNLLGVEKFGVIALFLAVAGVIAFLDLGLSPTLATELHNQRRSLQQRANLLFTYETAYAAVVGVVVLAALIAPASVFTLVLAAEDLARPAIAGAIRYVFVAAALQLLFNFYVAGLMGVEEQVRGNAVIVIAGIVRGGLVILPMLVYPEPAVYLLWQVVFVLVFAGVARHLLYASIESGTAGRNRKFEWRTIVENLSFTSGMFLISVTAAVNTQVDKLFIGRLVGIQALAEYSLVSTFAQLLVFLVSPITITLLPRFVRSVSLGDGDGVRHLFLIAHKSVAAIVCAAVGCMVFFGPNVISAWTMGKLDPAAIEHFVTPLVIGYALLAMGTVPHSIAVAQKDLRGALVIGFSLLLTVPAYWLSINRFGTVGAAMTWMVLQAIVVPLYTRWVDTKFIRILAPVRLFMHTLLAPLAMSLAVGFVASRFIASTTHPVASMAIGAVAGVLSVCGCLLITLRRADFEFFTRFERNRT